jgi:CheY-like chemotaxis protein
LSHGELMRGRYVCLAVSDAGEGFDESVARRLFEPFFTTRTGGTGLGLATVREVVRDHDGAVNVESKPGHGSRFEAWLPAAGTDSAAAAGAAKLPLGHGETVLVVESEREQLLGDEDMLAALGYEPVGFVHPSDAIAACRWEPSRFDIILVSHPSQNPGGMDVARALHEIALPILLATAATIDVNVDALAKAGVSEVLRRPLVGAELAAAMARFLRHAGMLQM